MIAKNSTAVEVGKPAPVFEAPSTSGKTAKLSDFKGSWLVLYFYPKSFTPGCTKESCSLRDGYADLQAKGAVILGVSLDTIEQQVKFKAEYKLPFDLISDEKKEVAKAYDVLGLAGLMAQRKTFLINPAGDIAYIFNSVNTSEHDTEVLAVLEKLQATPDQ